jgi:hypothetical protein
MLAAVVVVLEHQRLRLVEQAVAVLAGEQPQHLERLVLQTQVAVVVVLVQVVEASLVVLA